ncbi:MAG TPA: TIGR02281 family clan AA aspartic protease [Sideroxyarcus sp.]|nr:TIGR02281 family clan AA aspartic protease [Sideroxyarcus sp.]
MGNRRVRLAAIFLVLSASSAEAGTIFKCKGADGAMLYQEKPCAKEAQSVSSWGGRSSSSVEVDGDSGGANEALVIGQGDGGHYFIDGAVNDSYLNFVIDTGATVVSLPSSIAANSGIKCEGRTAMHTANGVTQACTATIQKLKVGHFTLRYVQAVVVPNLSQPLLGMNVLKQFRVEQDNGQMRLSRKY